MTKDAHDKIDRVIGFARGTVGKGVRLIDSTLDLPGIRRVSRHGHASTPGELPGIEHIAAVSVPPQPDSVVISHIDYCATQIETGDITDLDEFLAKPLPEWVAVRWINVSNTHPYVINLFRKQFEFHTLTAEDVLHSPQRPRVEFFDDHLFVVLRMLQLVQHETVGGSKDWVLDTEQVSLFLYDKVLITFQEKPGDVWQTIRDRLQTENARIRKNGTGYLLYALLDAIVDHCFPVLEQYGDVLEDLELDTLDKPSTELLHHIHSVKRQLAMLRRIVWPMREVVDLAKSVAYAAAF